jgi:hypothetical protein
MEQTAVVKAIQSLIQSSRCNARKRTPESTPTEDDVSLDAHKDAMLSQKLLDDCDSKSESTESGDGASDSGSHASEQTSTIADVSDVSSPSLGFVGTFRPPPGLELFAEDEAMEHIDLAAPPGLGFSGTRLNSEALPFVPACHMALPISTTWIPQVSPATATWEDPAAITWNYLTCGASQETPACTVPEKPFALVEQAVENMTKDEVDKLRLLLDTKETVKQISLDDMIVDARHQCAPAEITTKVSPKTGQQKNKASKQVAPRAVKSNETLQQSSEPQAEITLRSNLEELSKIDPAQVLMLRKINKLGPRAVDALNDYFSKFGSVDRVMISHSRAKSIYNPSTTRVRLAGLAFVVMSAVEAKQAALDLGKDHVVQGVGICVSEFEGNDCMENVDKTKGDEHDFNSLD